MRLTLTLNQKNPAYRRPRVEVDGPDRMTIVPRPEVYAINGLPRHLINRVVAQEYEGLSRVQRLLS